MKLKQLKAPAGKRTKASKISKTLLPSYVSEWVWTVILFCDPNNHLTLAEKLELRVFQSYSGDTSVGSLLKN